MFGRMGLYSGGRGSVVDRAVNIAGRQGGPANTAAFDRSGTKSSSGNAVQPSGLDQLESRILIKARAGLRTLYQGNQPKLAQVRAIRKVLDVDIGTEAAAFKVKQALSRTSSGNSPTPDMKNGCRSYIDWITETLKARQGIGGKGPRGQKKETAIVAAPAKNGGNAVIQAMRASRPPSSKPMRTSRAPAVERPQGPPPKSAAIAQAAADRAAAMLPTVAQAGAGQDAAQMAEEQTAPPPAPDAGLLATARSTWDRTPTWAKWAAGGVAVYVVARQLPVVGRILP